MLVEGQESLRETLRKALENKKGKRTADDVALVDCQHLWFWEDDYVLDMISAEDYFKFNPECEQIEELHSTRVGAVAAMMAELKDKIESTKSKKTKERLQKIYDNLKLDDSKSLIKGDTRNPKDKVDGFYL